MCGIVGTLNYGQSDAPVSPELIARMCSLILHRGPDDSGMYVDGPVGLGMRRLSIIDVAGGHQPLCNEDESIWLVYNGEIYNFKELQAELQSRGHQFRTRTDTEAVVHAYEEWGTACLGRFQGIFAFALWDARQRRLFIARDHLGVKPLYYWDNGTKLVWGSEAKTILLDPEYERLPNLAALGSFLRYRFVPGPDTFFQGICKLPPGHYLFCEVGSAPKVVQYWDVPCPVSAEAERPERAYAEELKERLQSSVRMQLVSEVPLGAFLSGGVDSASVVCLMSRLMNRPVQTFSVGFGGDPAVDELRYARQVAEHFGTDHHELVVQPASFDLLTEIIWHLDEPVADFAAIPTYLLARFAKQHVTVVLTGEGADELLAGYRKYYWGRQIDRFQRWPTALQRMALATLEILPGIPNRRKQKLIRWARMTGRERILEMMADISQDEMATLVAPEIAGTPGVELEAFAIPSDGEADGSDGLAAMLYLDAKSSLADDLLVKVDKMTMAASLEARVPYLDYHLVEFAMRIPASLKLKGSTGKYILRRAMADLLPPSIASRKKHVFQVPIGQWFRGDLRKYLTDVLGDRRTRERGYINSVALHQMLNAFWNGQTAFSQPLFTLLVLELWNRVFLDGEGDGALLTQHPERSSWTEMPV